VGETGESRGFINVSVRGALPRNTNKSSVDWLERTAESEEDMGREVQESIFHPIIPIQLIIVTI